MHSWLKTRSGIATSITTLTLLVAITLANMVLSIMLGGGMTTLRMAFDAQQKAATGSTVCPASVNYSGESIVFADKMGLMRDRLYAVEVLSGVSFFSIMIMCVAYAYVFTGKHW